MNILITAGGTSEKIDEVRQLTNHATGRLGSLIAQEFAAQADTQITYLAGQHSILPQKSENISVVLISSVQHLYNTLQDLFRTNTYDVIVHSMAVSDYQLKQVFTLDTLQQTLLEGLEAENFSSIAERANHLAHFLLQTTRSETQQEKKISSKTDGLFLSLEKAPKVIAKLREWQPKAILVGFKLLVGVSEKELFQVGFDLLKTNHCDFVLANDLETITINQHIGWLIEANGQKTEAKTKQEIATLLIKKTRERIQEK